MTENRSAQAQPILRRRLVLFAALGLAQGGALVVLLLDAVKSSVGEDVVLAARLMLTVATVLFMLTVQDGRWRAASIFAVAVASPVALLYLWAEIRFGVPYSTFEEVMFPAVIAAAVIAGVALPLFQRWLTERRLPFPYPAFFDDACRNVIAVAASGLFLGVAWLLLWLWASLFELVNVSFFKNLFGSTEFALPFSGMTVGLSLAVLREHARILRSIHDLSLALFAMLAPVLAVAAILFLAFLPFTGLTPLWDTGHATGVLLVVAFGAIFFVNAGIRGTAEGAPSRPMTVLLGVNLFFLPVFAGLAVYATALRVGQYGLTPDRVYALVFGGCAGLWTFAYAYAVARWRLAWTDEVLRYNPTLGVMTALVALAVLTPILDPYALSTRTQVDRLVSGRVAPEAFDFGLLKFKLGAPGRAALAQIRADSSLPQRAAIDRQLAILDRSDKYWRWRTNAHSQRVSEIDAQRVFGSFVRWPADHVVEQEFVDYLLASKRGLIKDCASKSQAICALLAADLTDDAATEYVFVRRYLRDSLRAYAFRRRGSSWHEYDQWFTRGTAAAETWDAIRRGSVAVVPPGHRVLRLGDRVVPLTPSK